MSGEVLLVGKKVRVFEAAVEGPPKSKVLEARFTVF